MKKLAALVVLLLVMLLIAFASIGPAYGGLSPDGWNDGRCGVSC